MSLLNLKNNQRGAILIFAVLILGSILAIALTLAAIFIPKIRASSDANVGSVGAIYAADSALEWCIYINRGNPDLPAPTMANGATYAITPNDCTIQPLTHQSVGTYHGVSRSLEVEAPSL